MARKILLVILLLPFVIILLPLLIIYFIVSFTTIGFTDSVAKFQAAIQRYKVQTYQLVELALLILAIAAGWFWAGWWGAILGGCGVVILLLLLTKSLQRVFLVKHNKAYLALSQAIEADDTSQIQTLLKTIEPDIRYTDIAQEGRKTKTRESRPPYPLHLALERGNIEAARLLLKRGANPNLPSELEPNRPVYPLQAAINQENSALVHLLLEHQADPNQPFVVKAEASSKKIISTTSLLRATDLQNEEIVALLLKFGANPNQLVPKNALTPLYKAVSLQNRTLTNLLLDHGADPNRGLSPLKYAVEHQDQAAIEELLPLTELASEVGYEILRCAVQQNDPTLVERLLAEGAAVKQVSGPESVIYTAVKNNNAAAARLLLKHGVEATGGGETILETKKDAGWDHDKREWKSALYLAIEQNLTDICFLLLDHGADPRQGKKIYETLDQEPVHTLSEEPALDLARSMTNQDLLDKMKARLQNL